MCKKALILGITGQDGSYLAEILLKKNYEVHGLIRRSSTGNLKNINHLIDQIIIHKGDLADTTSLYRVINEIQPEYIYNEADQDHVSWSYSAVDYSCDITGSAVARLLEIMKQVNPNIKFFQPLSSNMFGKAANSPQNENSPFNPQSPYGAAKVFAYVLCKYYREVYNLFISTAIFYNHESLRRSDEYVTRKISKGVARISKGLQKKLYLGNLDQKVDFGYAPEYMEAAYNIMQLDKPDDFVIGSGSTYSIKEFVKTAFDTVNLNYKDYVEIDSKLVRPSDTTLLQADFSKANKVFGFKPKKKFQDIVKEMVLGDINILNQTLKN